MAKNAPAIVPALERPRGRPLKPGGRLSQVEIQRAYRDRLAAAGKVVRVVDVAAVSLAPQVVPAFPDFDPARDGIYEREMIETMRENLHKTSLRLENIQEDMKRLEQRNAYLEGELKLLEQPPYECAERQNSAQAATG